MKQTLDELTLELYNAAEKELQPERDAKTDRFLSAEKALTQAHRELDEAEEAMDAVDARWANLWPEAEAKAKEILEGL